MRIKLGIVCLCCLMGITINRLSAQVSVTGLVTDSSGHPIPSVSISLLEKQKGVVLAYAISDSKGHYQLRSTTASVKDTLLLQAVMAGYARYTIPVSRAEQVADFRLLVSAFSLPEITVKANKVIVKLEGDTIYYDVSSFISPQDRVIGDIIKKIPGLEMDGDGKITYNGKAINRFYIDGENLLDGKYNIATKSIPADMVEKLQILENHQPIKSLKNIVSSGDPAMNIVLKDKARKRPIGQGDMSLGSPEAYGGTVNVMMFKKKIQYINYIKLNNIGVDISNDLLSHFGGNQENIPAQLMNIGINNPPLSKGRYLFNHSTLININHLSKLQNDFQLRINASYMVDKRYQHYGSMVNYFLPSDTIHYEEKQNSRTYVNILHTQFTLTANKSGYYLNNVLLLDNAPQQIWGNLQATGIGNIDQQMSGTITNISNELNYTKLFKDDKHLIEGYSYINLVRNPATLQVSPGLNEALFNGGNPYAGLVQDAAIPSLYNNNYLSYKTGGMLRQSYKVGFAYQKQDLISALQSIQLNGVSAIVSDSFVNRIAWKRLRVYLQSDYSLVTGKLELTLSIPLNYIKTKYGRTGQEQQLTVLPVMPVLYLKYNCGKENYITMRYSYSINWGDIKNVYDGYIMQTYRNFVTNVSFLPETRMHNVSAGYYFKNTLKIFFFNINATYSSSAANSIAANTYSSVLQQSKNILLRNITENKSLSGSISKYLFSLKTTVGAKMALQQNTGNQLLNGILLKYHGDILSVGTNINSKLTSWWNMGYSNTFSKFTNGPLSESLPTNKNKQEVITILHQGEMNISLNQNVLIKLSGDYYFNCIKSVSETKAFFIDAAFTYKWNKLKTDIDISLNNIADTKEYTSIISLSNMLSTHVYQIRSRMLLLKFLYRF